MASRFDGKAGHATAEPRATFQHLYDIVTHRAATHPRAIALGGQQGLAWKTLTSSALLELVNLLAIELADLGVREGDRVILWLPSHWRTPVYLFALWRLGAVVVPFDREMNAEAADAIQKSVDPRLIVAGFDERPPWMSQREVVDWWEPGTRIRSTGSNGAWRRPAEELAAIFFTSGTTGRPKGCMITHANLLSQVDALPANFGLDSTCRLASVLPLSHLFEMTCGLIYPLAEGAAIHYVPSRRGPDIVRVLFEQRITHMIVVPQLLAAMGQALDKQLQNSLPGPVYSALNAVAERVTLPTRYRLFWFAHRRLGGHLRTFASGGAALPAETQLFWERLGVQVVQGYGASECSPVIACGNADGSTPIGTVGRPIQGVEVRISAEGELLVRGPNVMRGYWKDPARTADVIRDGWYSTGDLATIDERGNIRLSGRAKDLIALPSGMNDRGAEGVSADVPLWPYTWGRAFRILATPFSLIYRLAVTRTIVLGADYLNALTPPVIFAGTHHGFADMPLVRRGIGQSPARGLLRRLVIATAAKNWDDARWFTRFVTLAYGLYPLRQRGERDASLRGLVRLCERGSALLIFPQGHHVRPEQERAGERAAAFQSGVGFLANALDATVVPFGVAGTENVLKSGPADSGGMTLGNIAVSIHRGPLAISFAAPVKMRSDESSHAFAARLQAICFQATTEAERALADL